MTTASKAQYKQNLKKFRQALSGKYKVRPTTQTAYVVGDGHIKIDGRYYDATTSGIAGTTATVVNIGRPAAAIYSTAEGGTVVTAGAGSSSSSGGTGTPADTATIEALKASAYVVMALNGTLTNERLLTVSAPLNLSDGGGNNAVNLSVATPPTLSVSSINDAATGSHAITASAAPGAATALLKSAVDGSLTLPSFIATTLVRSPLIDTASGNLTISPASATVTVNNNLTAVGTAQGAILIGTTKVRSPLIDTASGDLTIAPSSQLVLINHNLTATGTVQAGILIGTTKLRTPLIDTASGNLSIAPAGATTAITGALTVSTTATVTTSVQTPLLTTASNVDLVINPAGTGAVQFHNDQTLRTSSFDSSFPITGWQLNEVAGVSGYSALTIGKIQADELAVRVFVADEVRVDRGDEYWTKSYGIVAANFVSPASIGGTVSVMFEDSPALVGAIFANNDWVLIRKLEIDSGLTLFNLWGQVSSYVNNSDGTQNWTFTLRSGPTSEAITKGSLAIDFGASGAALIHLSVIDAAGAPYIKMRKWAGANPYTPSNYTTYVQLGNLGSIGNSYYTPAGYGLYVRSTAAEGKFIVADDNGIQIRGADFKLYTGSNQTVNIASTDGSVKLGTNISSSATTNFDFNGTTGALLIKGSLSAADGDMVANEYGLSIAAFYNSPISWTNYGQALKFSIDPSIGAEDNTVAQISAYRNTEGSPSYNLMSIESRAGVDYGTDDAIIQINAHDYDADAQGSASITVYAKATGANEVTISSVTPAGAPSTIGLYGNTLTWDIRPYANNTYDIGTSSYYYDHAYIRNLHVDTVVGTPTYSHQHAASDITSGTLDIARMPSGVVQATRTVTGGAGLAGGGALSSDISLTHGATSSVTSVNNSNGNVIQDLTFDTYGHVTAHGSVDLDARYALIGDLSGYVPASRTVTAGAGLSGGGALSADITISHADTSSQASVNNSGTTFIQDITLDTYGHITAITSVDTSTALDSLYVNIAGDTMTGNLSLNADVAAGNSMHLSFLTNNGINAQWQLIARAHDYATTGEQNDFIVSWYNGTSSNVALYLDNSTLNATFGGAITSASSISATGAGTFGGVITAASNTDANNTLGRAIVGYGAASDSATFAHFDYHTSTNFALAQFSDGSTQINTVTGQEISLSVNDVTTYSVSADRLLPRSSVAVDIGDYNRKVRTIHAAEMAVQTLIAQEVISTVGGQILVSKTSQLIADISSTGVVGGSDVIATNMVAYWSLDEVGGTRLDSKGISHLSDKNTVTSTTGKVGISAVFNRANSERLTITDSATLSVGNIDFYMAVWIYATNDDGNVHCIASKGGSSGDRAWELQLDWSDNRVEFTVYNSSNTATTVNSGTVSVNTWYFVEAWHNATSNLIGVAINRTETTTAHSTGVKDDTSAFTIGARGSGNYYTGRIDEFGYWKNYIPDTTRRDFIYNSGSGRSYTDIYNYGAGAFNMDLKHNSFVIGEFVHMSAAPGGVQQREVFKITSSASAITGGYRYSAERNLDGSGANNWYAGDSVASLGAAIGEGYIDLTATSTIHSHYGPTIAHYVRRGTGAWDSVAPVVVSGNLRSFVDYTTDEFGHAAGNDLLLTPAEGFKGYTIDTVNGMRTFNVDISLYEADTEFLSIGTDSGIQIETNEFSTNDNRSISFNRLGVNRSYIRTWEATNLNTLTIQTAIPAGIDNKIDIKSIVDTGQSAFASMAAQNPAGGSSYISLTGLPTANSSYIILETDGSITMNADLINANADIDMNGNDIIDIGNFGAWTNISFNTGWGNLGSGFATGQYRKVGDMVQLRGVVVRTSGSSTTITTLGAGYRPAAQTVCKVDSANAHGRVDITTGGVVALLVGTATDYVSLNGVVFSTL